MRGYDIIRELYLGNLHPCDRSFRTDTDFAITMDAFMLTINALAAVNEIIIPSLAHYLSLRGMEQLIRTISNVKRKINPGLEIAGILITMADMRTNYSREIVDLLRNTYGSKLRIFDSIIPMSIRAAETSAEGRSIFLHDPAGKVCAAYAALTREVLT